MFDPHIQIRRGAYLPHWTKTDGIYHVRFRLVDSLPQQKIRELEDERKILLNELLKNGKLNSAQKMNMYDLFSEKIEGFLHAGHGSCWLQREDIAQLMVNALRHFEGKRYNLFAWCVMPNHVHLLVQPNNDYKLCEIVQSWKAYTARFANKILGRAGAFWQPEYFDHLIRNADSFERCVEYIWSNPDVAGLVQWPHRWKKAVINQEFAWA